MISVRKIYFFVQAYLIYIFRIKGVYQSKTEKRGQEGGWVKEQLEGVLEAAERTSVGMTD